MVETSLVATFCSPTVSDKDATLASDQKLEGAVPRILGLELRLSKTWQFIFLASGSLLFAIGFSTLQEHVFRLPGFRFGGWMTFITYITFIACAVCERLLTGDLQRRSKLKDFAMVSVLTMSGLYLTNMSLNYLDYATRVVFKSSKVVPTMAFGFVVQGRRYSWQQYAAGLLLVAGISSFTLGDRALSPRFSFAGVALISAALVCDSLTGNLEERLFFRKPSPSTQAEVILYTSAFSCAGAAAVLVATGELLPAARHSLAHAETLPLISLSSCLGYLSVTFILSLIQHFDATRTEIVKSLRKVLQVVVSFVLFAKPVNARILGGGAAVALALYWFQASSRAGPPPSRPEAGPAEHLPAPVPCSDHGSAQKRGSRHTSPS